MRLRHPLPTLNQQLALLPDGSADPANQTDCGETSVAIVLRAAGKGELSPGCIRQWLGLPEGSGITDAGMLALILGRTGLEVSIRSEDAESAWVVVRDAAAQGRGSIILGTWESPDEGHWMVTGRRSGEGVWVSDPWTGTIRNLTWDSFSSKFESSMVVVLG